MYGDEPHFLETGISARLTLSLASGVPADVDFALDRLLTTSLMEPEYLSLEKFPGMLDALLSLIREYALSLDRPPAPLQRLFADRTRRDRHRRATEAALVVRNLATFQPLARPLKSNKRLQPTLVVGLTLAHRDDEADNELIGYLLDTTEVMAPSSLIAPPAVRPARDLDDDPDDEDPRWLAELARVAEAQASGRRLLDALGHLTTNKDRALVLGAFRTLAALGTVLENRPLLAETSLVPDRQSGVRPLDRTLELLPLDDADLVLPVLDYLYAATWIHAGAVPICASSTLLPRILRILLSLSHHRFTSQSLPPRQLAWPSTEWFWSTQALLSSTSDPASSSSPSKSSIDFAAVAMSDSDLSPIVDLAEPDRCRRWMRHVFESDPDAEVQQVDLWNAYKEQFATRQEKSTILAASEVIKLSQEAFPEAMPMVNEQRGSRLFVIRGMRVRERVDWFAYYACKWEGCYFHGAADPSSLYSHVLSHHLSSSSSSGPGHVCLWSSDECRQRSPSRSDLAMHVRTHIPVHPSLRPPPSFPTTKPKKPSSSATDPRPLNTLAQSRLVPPGDSAWGVQGIGYTALLVVRNLSRCVVTALAASEKRAQSGRHDESEDRRQAREFGILGRLVAADRRLGSGTVDESAADAEGGEGVGEEAVGTIVAMEKELVETWSSMDAGVGQVALDVLGIIDGLGRSVVPDKKDGDEPMDEDDE